MNIVAKPAFRRVAKKLHRTQKEALDAAVGLIMENPFLGEMKVGDIHGIRTYKFRMVNQITLLAYTYDGETITLTLLAFGPHENFYRDLKK